MKKWIVFCGIIFFASFLFGETITWEIDGQGRVTGKVVRQESGETWDVDIESSVLPTGAATSANQDTANAHLATISDNTSPETTNAIKTATESIDGKMTACDTTGKATAANQSTGNTHLATISDNTDPETIVAVKTAVEAINTALQSGGITQTQLDAIKTALEIIDNVIAGNEIQADIVSSALPTGAATSANQTTGNTSLGSIKTNTDPLVTAGGGGYIRQDSTATIAKETGGNLATIAGKDFATQTKLSALNTKVTACDTTGKATAANQATANTHLATISDNTSPETMNAIKTAAESMDGKMTACNTGAIAGTVTANAGTNLNTSDLALEAGGNLATIAGKDFATQTTLSALNTKVTVCDTTGKATAANQSTANTSLSSIDGKIPASPSDSTRQDTEIAHLAAIKTATESIDGKMTACNTGAIAGTVTANAGTNLNTSALALEAGGNLATIAGKDFATQTTLSALNTKVTACDTTGKATAANQSTGNTSLSSIDGKMTACNTGAVVGTVSTNKLTNGMTLIRKETSQDLSASALSYTTNFAAKTRIKQILFHASGAISETVTVTFNSTTSANYDTVLKTETLSSEQNYMWIPDGDFVLLSGDEVDVACTNAGGVNTVYVTVIGETLN